MKVVYTAGKLSFEQECRSRLEAFEFAAKLMEIFVSEPCGVCGCKDNHPVVRKHGEFTFYELVCEATACGAKLGYFKRDDMFFPQRKAADKSWLPTRGWSVYKPAGERQSQAQDADPRDVPTDPDGLVPF